MKKIITFLIFLAFVIAETNLKAQAWVKLAALPEGAAVADLAVDNNNVVYMLTALSDLYYTTNNGVSWTKMPTAVTFMNTSHIAVDKITNTLYVGTVSQGIHWTSNKGLSWQNHPITTNTISGFNSYINGIVRKPSTNILVCNEPDLNHTSQIHRSLNAGLSWSTTTVNFGSANEFVYLSNSTILAATELGVFRSLDDGVTWSASNTGMVNMNINNVVEKTASSKIFAAADFNNNTSDTSACGVFVSSDGGLTWSDASTGMSNCKITDLVLGSNGDLYATYYDGVYRSANDGQTWALVNSGLGSADFTCLSANSSGIFAGSRKSGVAFSVSPITGWNFRNSGLKLTTINHLALGNTGDVHVLDFANTGVYRYTSSNWASQNNGLPSSMGLQLIKDHNGVLYASYTGETTCLYKSLNQGVTWIPLSTLPVPPNISWTSCSIVKVDNHNNLYVVRNVSPTYTNTLFEPQRLFRSSDQGLTWTHIFSPDSNYFGINDFDLTSDSAIYISLTNINTMQTDYIYSSNFGTTFSPFSNTITVPFATNDLVIAPNDALYFFQENILYKRNGTQWIQLTSNDWDPVYNNHPTNLYIDKLNNLYVTSRFEGVFYSADNGVTWSNISTGLPILTSYSGLPPVHIYDLQFDNNNIPYALSTDNDAGNISGMGIYKYTVAPTNTVGLITPKATNSILSVYPNPASHICTVTYAIKYYDQASIQLYNASGILIKNFEKTEIKEGGGHISFDMSEFTVGIYFIKAFINGENHLTKIIKD